MGIPDLWSRERGEYPRSHDIWWSSPETCSKLFTGDTHLTPSGSHQNMYGCQAGGAHHTGMLSCLYLIVEEGYFVMRKRDVPTPNIRPRIKNSK